VKASHFVFDLLPWREEKMAPVESEQRMSGKSPIPEMHILWMTAGLGCDGDTIAVTAATQPSIEDLVLGTFPWIPKVKFYNPFLAYENGDEFVQYFRDAAEGRLTPYMLVVEGSIPNEKNKKEGYWATFGTDAKTGQPITTCDWIDQLAPKAWAVVAAGTCATPIFHRNGAFPCICISAGLW
jgi:hydrogenase small subunit